MTGSLGLGRCLGELGLVKVLGVGLMVNREGRREGLGL